jgi:hypothetical protein
MKNTFQAQQRLPLVDTCQSERTTKVNYQMTQQRASLSARLASELRLVKKTHKEFLQQGWFCQFCE